MNRDFLIETGNRAGRALFSMVLSLGSIAVSNEASAAATLDRVAQDQVRYKACLETRLPASLNAIAEPNAKKGDLRLLRARLIFRAGAAEPQVDWLWKADEAAAVQLEPHLRRYRMACIEAGEAPQARVQEIWLDPATGRLSSDGLWRTSDPQSTDASSCYSGPTKSVEYGRGLHDAPSKALVFFRFPSDEGEPEVEIAHSTGSSSFADSVRRTVRSYKRCGGKRTTEAWHQQVYVYYPEGVKAPSFKPLTLAGFLGLVKDMEKLQARFDFNTMQCPFQVDFAMYQPVLNNEARVEGARNPNRDAFLGWLSKQRLNFPSPAESGLFGEQLKIEVPCMVLDLHAT